MTPASPLVPGQGAEHFEFTIETLLLIMGGVMTIGVGIVGIWLIRQMRRDDRGSRADDGGGA